MKKLLTMKEVAEHLQVSVRTIQSWVKDGYFPEPIRFGRRPYFTVDMIEALERGEKW